ncbi:MAG: SurA N-terminal domain-containing protein [Bacteroidetes bacterium]|nr:SurA N-terminal domain-containing protein [Bacteroidota bacterium]
MTVIFAGLAGAFLLMIVFEWGAQGDFFRSGPKGDEIGEVNGQAISNKEFNDMLQMVRQQKLSETKKSALSEAEEAEVNSQAWDQLLTTKLIDQKLTQYGITVTDQEVRDRMFYNPPDDIRRSFVDSAGRFHQQEYWQVLRDPKYDTILTPYVQRMRESMKREKLQSILLATIRLTNDEMWERYDIQTAKATFDVVKIVPPQNQFNDMVSKVTDDEVKAYYDNHKWEYKQDEARKIKFVVFRYIPTAKDSASVFERARSLAKRWQSLPLAESDSAGADLARDYSDDPFVHSAPLDLKTLGSVLNADSLLAAKPGDVVICPTAQGQVKVMRVISIADTGEQLVHAKQIVMGVGKTGAERDSAKARAERVVAQLRSGANFAEMARQYSEDPSARTGGDMRWLPEKTIPSEVLSVVNKEPVGSIVGPIEGPMGFIIMQLNGRSSHKLTVQTVNLDIRASSQTTKMVQQQATIFREQATKKGFDQAAKDMDMRVITDAPLVQLRGSQPLFGYMPFAYYIFDLSVGDITVPVQISAARISVVAQVVENIPKGARPLDEELKRVIKSQVAKKKMVESVYAHAQQLRNSLGPNDDLSKLTAMDATLTVQRVTSGPGESTQQLGTEYELNAAVFNLKNPGEITPAVKGQGACFIAKLVSMQPTQKEDYEKHKAGLFQNLAKEKEQRFFSSWLEDLKTSAKIKDFRIARN